MENYILKKTVMNEYAKQKALSFQKWLNENYIAVYKDHEREFGLLHYVARSFKNPGNWQLEELYDQFAESLIKQ